MRLKKYKILSVLLIISAMPICLFSQNPEIMETINNDKFNLEKLYYDMYSCMISKDTESLGKLLDEDFVLVHMTGMRQPKREYLKAIKDGVLNYYSCEDSEVTVTVNGDKAEMTGKSKVNAAVFGGGTHTWRLQLDMDLKRKDGQWEITEIRASTY